jgi:hypothetical protein
MLAALGWMPSIPAAGVETGPQAAFENEVQPLLEKYCYACHGHGRRKGDVSLETDRTIAEIHAHAKIWETVLERVSSHEMPPEDAELQPPPAERERITGWIERELFQLDPANPDPGRVTIHRLNRVEYNNTIRDLVGVNFQPADDFPADNSGYGFDNISDVLSLSPVLLEKYLQAANRILDEALPTAARQARVTHLRANLMLVGFNATFDFGDGWMPLGSLEEDAVSTIMTFAPGDYRVKVLAYATPEGKSLSSDKPLSEVPIVLSCTVDDALVGTWPVDAPKDRPRVFELRLGLPAGRHRVAFVNRRIRGGDNELIMSKGRPGPLQGGTVYVKTVDIEGPLPTKTLRMPAASLAASGGAKTTPAGSRFFEHEGEVALHYTVPSTGEYLFRAQAYAQQAGAQPAQMEFRVDGKPVRVFDVQAPAKLQPLPDQRVFSDVLLNAVPQIYEYRLTLPRGEHRLAAAFINDFADAANPNPNLRDRNLIVDHLELAGLTEPAGLPDYAEPIRKLFAKAATPPRPTGIKGALARLTGRTPPLPTDAERARIVIGDFTRLAWRRPITPAELDELMQLYASAVAEGESFPAGVKFALKAVLVSPYFLFRGEQAAPASPLSPLAQH